MKFESRNPSTGEIIGHFDSTPPDIIRSLVAASREAHAGWKNLPLSKRATACRRFADLLFERRQEMSELISRENGKPIVEVYSTEILPSIDIVRYCVRHSRKVYRDRRVKIHLPLLLTKKSYVSYEPFGVVAIISPRNYPLLLPVGQIIPALLAGNGVIFKPSEHTPSVGELIARLIADAGIPRGLFGIVHGAGETGSELVSSGVDKIFFTGSTRTGKKISAAAASNLTPASLELGGKDAMIVLPDADLDAAASAAVWGGFMNAGQTCVSIERCFVHQSIFDQFSDMLVKKVGLLRHAGQENPEPDVGTIIHGEQFRTIKSHLEEAVKRGARVLAGGACRENGSTYFVEPTVLTDVPLDALVITEETFGPVLPLIRFHTDDEAVKMTNESRFGLSASIWTSDRDRGTRMARELKAGAVILNDVVSYYGMSDGVVGGVKESGSGRVHGEEGLREMVYPKYYEIERARKMKKAWWYGYDRNTLAFFQASTSFLYSRRTLEKIRALGKLLMSFMRMKKI